MKFSERLAHRIESRRTVPVCSKVCEPSRFAAPSEEGKARRFTYLASVKAGRFTTTEGTKPLDTGQLIGEEGGSDDSILFSVRDDHCDHY